MKEPITPKHVAALFQDCELAGLRYPKPFTKEVAAVWLRHLGGISAGEFQWASKQYLESCAEYPTPADIRKLVQDQRERRAQVPNVALDLDRPTLTAPRVTREFHRERKAKLDALFEQIEAKFGTTPRVGTAPRESQAQGGADRPDLAGDFAVPPGCRYNPLADPSLPPTVAATRYRALLARDS